jgi:hypothetical protein
MLEQVADSGDIIGGEIDLGGDFGVAVPPFLEGADFAHQLERARVAASQVLDQAHYITVLFRRFDDNRRDLALPQGDERLTGESSSRTRFRRSLTPAYSNSHHGKQAGHAGHAYARDGRTVRFGAHRIAAFGCAPSLVSPADPDI